MRPVLRLRYLFAAALAAPAVFVTGCASSDDRLGRIEERLAGLDERLAAVDARVAELDVRTQPPLTIPLPWFRPTPGTSWSPWNLPVPLRGVPSSWRPVLDDGGCVLPTPPFPLRFRVVLVPGTPGDGPAPK